MASSGNSTSLDLEQLRSVVQHGRPEEIAAWLRFPLEMALSAADLERVRCLVGAGADAGPGWKGRDGRSLLDAAAYGGNVDAIRIVLERKDAKIDLDTPSGNKGMVPLMRAVVGRHVDAARLLVNVGADVKVCDNDGYTSLHHALLQSLTEIAELLIVAGSDVSARTMKGVTPTLLTMTHVSVGGGANLFYILLQRNADVNAVDEDERSLVHAAVKHGKLEYLEALLKAGAMPYTKNRWGNTPLHDAVTFRASVDIVSFLAKQDDVNVNATNSCGNTPLVESMRKCNVEGARALLNAGATVTDTHTEDGRDFPLLYLAKSSVPMTQLLLKRGALSHTGAGLKFGFSALHWAAAEGSPGVLRALCERADAEGMDVDVRFGVLLKDGRSFRRGTALFLAVLYGPESPRRLKCIVSLLKLSADPNAKDDNGFTPLALLCWGLSKGGLGWRVRVADLLLRNEADEKLANVDGNTPLDLLKEEDDPDGIMRRLLQNADVDRVWRRRGMLVLCRSWVAKTGKRSVREKGKSRARRKKRVEWVEWLARVKEEDIFRAVISFL